MFTGLILKKKENKHDAMPLSQITYPPMSVVKINLLEHVE